MYANINLCYSFPSVNNKHNNVDIAVIRENTEGEFSGIEHEVYPGVMESLKVTTRANSERLIQYAFEFAHFSGRKKVSVIHKANIMKLVDGLFLEVARGIAKKYPFIKYEEMIVDNCSMQLVKNPSQFDVMVAPNLYGTIISHICAGKSICNVRNYRRCWYDSRCLYWKRACIIFPRNAPLWNVHRWKKYRKSNLNAFKFSHDVEIFGTSKIRRSNFYCLELSIGRRKSKNEGYWRTLNYLTVYKGSDSSFVKKRSQYCIHFILIHPYFLIYFLLSSCYL